MLHKLNRQLTETILISLENQAAIKALNSQKAKPSHYLMDRIHNAAEALHAKQDKLFNQRLVCETQERGRTWRASTRGFINIWVQWVPDHINFAPNKKANEEAKCAAQGYLSPSRDLPRFLRKPLLASVSALRQQSNGKIQRRWARQWKSSPRYLYLLSINNSVPSKKFLSLTNLSLVGKHLS